MAEHKPYSMNDIQRYHEGKLSSKEMHALEKAALEDPFLADALEGYVHTNNASADSIELKQRLHNRINKQNDKKVFFLTSTPLRVAALVLLILGLGWISYQVIQKPSGNIALERTPNASTIQDTTNANPPLVQKDLTAKDSVSFREKEENHQNGLIQKVDIASTKRIAKQKPIEEQKETSIASRKPETIEITSAPVALSDAYARKANIQATPDTQQTTNTFSGRVTDASGNAVAFSTIRNRQNNALVQSDTNGNFKILAKDSVVNVDVAAAGYNSKTTQLNTDTSNKITLEPSSGALQEVVVTGMGVRKKRSEALPKKQVIIEELEPEEGVAAYNDYVQDYMHNLDHEQKDKGKVTLTFDVNSQGEPVNIAVVNTSCEKCTEEAKKLLQEGPKWKKKKNKKAKITIDFNAPR